MTYLGALNPNGIKFPLSGLREPCGRDCKIIRKQRGCWIPRKQSQLNTQDRSAYELTEVVAAFIGPVKVWAYQGPRAERGCRHKIRSPLRSSLQSITILEWKFRFFFQHSYIYSLSIYNTLEARLHTQT